MWRVRGQKQRPGWTTATRTHVMQRQDCLEAAASQLEGEKSSHTREKQGLALMYSSPSRGRDESEDLNQHCPCTAGMPGRRGHWGQSWEQTHCVLSVEADGTRNQTWEKAGCWLCGFKNTLEKPFQRKSSLAGCLCVSFGPQECFTSNGN